MLSMGQQGWPAPFDATREFGALNRIHSLGSMDTAESVAAKFSQVAPHPVLPTQGCSQSCSQGLAEGAPGSQRLLLSRIASHQHRSRRGDLIGTGTRGEQRFRGQRRTRRAWPRRQVQTASA